MNKTTTTLLAALGNVDGAVAEATIGGQTIQIIQYFNPINGHSFIGLIEDGNPALCPSCLHAWHMLKSSRKDIDSALLCMTRSKTPYAQQAIWNAVQVRPWK